MKNSKPVTKYIGQTGMTMVETIISFMLLSLFFTIYTTFVQVSSKYNKRQNNNLDNSNGLTIDHHYLYMTLDEYASILSQPGISLDEINTIKNKKTGNLPEGCSFSPNITWDLPVRSKPINGVNWQPSNANYAICLKSTSILESSLSDLILKSKGNSSNAQPGLYFLVALPNEITIDSLPVRKLFCRPQPYC